MHIYIELYIYTHTLFIVQIIIEHLFMQVSIQKNSAELSCKTREVRRHPRKLRHSDVGVHLALGGAGRSRAELPCNGSV